MENNNKIIEAIEYNFCSFKNKPTDTPTHVIQQRTKYWGEEANIYKIKELDQNNLKIIENFISQNAVDYYNYRFITFQRFLESLWEQL